MATKFVFLLLPQVHILDLAGPDQAIHEAIDFGADFEIEYCGNSASLFTTSGLPLGKVVHFSKIRMAQGDFLVIPGCSYQYLSSREFLQQIELFAWLRKLYQNGISLVSICMGAFVLAESGLLNDRQCTTHFKKTDALQKKYPALKVIENILYTDQDNIYTSAGIASGIDLALHLIEKLKGSHFAHLVARELVVFSRRKANDSQESEFLKFRNHIHSGIHAVQDFILENIDKKNHLPDLADVAAMSERNFTRIFKKESGVTVNQYINSIRKAKAHEWMKNLNLSRAEIAARVGLQSEKQLTRILANPSL
ncbi:MAG: DJ-1/PfpI family protein [Saprospiraceae bacterium]|nr:DJ-1/PfpI family protein [Saprospiraceae bacterium]MBL0083000.1 DJ-1/PfpI family protein [Saprospiraceae bacterium]